MELLGRRGYRFEPISTEVVSLAAYRVERSAVSA